MMEGPLQSLVQALPLPAVLIGGDWRVLAANALAVDMLGEGLETRHYMTMLRQPSVLDAIEACAQTGQPQQTRYLGADGANETTFETQCAAVDTGPTGQGVLVTFTDITHLQQASQMRRDFVANVSHELRSPLTALTGFIETLAGPARDDPAATARFLTIMQGEAARMERLVRDLLSLSRVEAQERIRPQTPVDLGDLARSVIHLLTPQATAAQVTLALSGPDTPQTVPGDADQLRQVLTNLIENAIKYGGRDQQVQITLTTSPDEPLIRGPAAQISVRDHGPGFDPVHISRLTERFYRVDDHRSREMGGTGLGLAIVKHILNRHRGRLRITTTPGEGSEFIVILPL